MLRLALDVVTIESRLLPISALYVRMRLLTLEIDFDWWSDCGGTRMVLLRYYCSHRTAAHTHYSITHININLRDLFVDLSSQSVSLTPVAATHTHTHTPLLHRWTFRCCSCSFHWRPQLITKFQNIYVYASRWLPAHKYTNTEKATIDIHIDGDFWWFFQSNSLHRHKTQSPLWMRWKVKHLPSSILLGLHPQQQISSVSGAEIFNFCLHSARSIVKLCELIWYASFILNMYETPRQWTDGPVSIILLYDYVVRFHITNKYLHTQTHNVDL